MGKYNLVGVGGNAFSIIGYVRQAMKCEGCTSEGIKNYIDDAMSSDYNHLLNASIDIINQLNTNSNGD